MSEMSDADLRAHLAHARDELEAVSHRRLTLLARIDELTRQITPRTERCQACMGKGAVPRQGSEWIEASCPACNGTGKWREPV